MLEYLSVTTAEFLWNDHGTLAPLDLSVWRPNVPPGYFALGDVTTRSSRLRSLSDEGVVALCVREKDAKDTGRYLRPPVGYELEWDEGGTRAQKVALWRPVPPPQYVALGFVATGSAILRPSRSLVRCVHESLVERAPHDPVLRWSTEGTAARRAVSIWTLAAGDFPWRDSLTVLKAAVSAPHPSVWPLRLRGAALVSADDVAAAAASSAGPERVARDDRCPSCAGHGAISVFGLGCAKDSLHVFNQCTTCGGAGRVDEQLLRCPTCRGLGGFSSFGPCDMTSIFFSRACELCVGRRYVPSSSSSSSSSAPNAPVAVASR